MPGVIFLRRYKHFFAMFETNPGVLIVILCLETQLLSALSVINQPAAKAACATQPFFFFKSTLSFCSYTEVLLAGQNLIFKNYSNNQ